MKTSARNQLIGKISQIKSGPVNSEIVIGLEGGPTLQAIITNDAAAEMALDIGQTVIAIIKSSFVILSKDKPGKISTRNILEAKIAEAISGTVSCEIKLSMGSHKLTAMITREAVDELGLQPGDTVYALIKASSIILAQE